MLSTQVKYVWIIELFEKNDYDWTWAWTWLNLTDYDWTWTSLTDTVQKGIEEDEEDKGDLKTFFKNPIKNFL